MTKHEKITELMIEALKERGATEYEIEIFLEYHKSYYEKLIEKALIAFKNCE
jgi:hypothetical protein